MEYIPIEERITSIEATQKEMLWLLQSIVNTGFSADKSSKMLDINEAAKMLKLSVSRLHTLTSKKEIPHYKNGRKLVFDADELDAYRKRNKIKTNEEIEIAANTYLAISKHKSNSLNIK
jgi:excisionase family DNA binding protein